MALLELEIERAVAGGRMLARHDGIVVLVAGAVPGERVRARIERRTKSLIWADATEVLDASPARRPPICDRACGGMDYGHIQYSEQLRLKGEVVGDAFRRIGKIDLGGLPQVMPSPEQGYRLRARLHVRGGRAGFFREGTHELCDASKTRQLRDDTVTAVDGLLASLGAATRVLDAIVVAENVGATQRVVHLEPKPASQPDARWTMKSLSPDVLGGTTGITTTQGRLMATVAGSPYLTDTASDLFAADAPVPDGTRWTRQGTSFFQGNRFLTGPLVRHVLAVTPGARVADLYAGVGLFAVAFAARGARVTAVEGDYASGEDLQRNMEPWLSAAEIRRASVEDAAAGFAVGQFDAIVVDPPRTGLSPAALASLIRLQPPTLVYVSCDPATLARDAAKLLAADFAIDSIRAFDLFPNTAHIETVLVVRSTR